MRIAVTRTGGFAGITRKAELDTTGRPDAARLEALARDALVPAGPLPKAPAVPDSFVYTITVDGETVRGAERQLSEAQRALVRAVLEDGTADGG